MNKPYPYKPVKFFLAVNLIMWITWIVAGYSSYHPFNESSILVSILIILGMLSPAIVALWMVFTSCSRELKQNFYERLVSLKLIKPSSLLSAVLIMPLTVVISVTISHWLFGQSWDQLSIPKKANFSAGFLPVPLLLFGAAFVEELGWKGYGVDSLRGKSTFFINGYYQNMLIRTNPLFAINFIVSIIPAAFIVNWLWYKNKGSILMAVLFHASCNFQGILQMGQIAKCIQTVVMLIVVLIIVLLNKKMFFDKFPAKIGYYGQQL